MNITVYGSGGWGTAIAALLADNGHSVTLWSYTKKNADIVSKTRQSPHLAGVILPDGVKSEYDIEKVSENVDMAIMATPSYAVAKTARMLAGKLPSGCTVVCISKGIEQDTSRRFSEILRAELGEDVKIASLSGPTHAEEVGTKVPSACVVACEDTDVAVDVQRVFMNEYFRVYTTDDVVGVEIGAALKNVIAMCAGISDGLNFGDNTKAMLMTRGLNEMADLAMAMGGRRDTLAGLAGVGDLIVTCTSMHSRNRRAGILIGEGLSAEEAMEEVGAVVEGYYACKAAYKLGKITGVDMPIINEAYEVLYNGKDAAIAVRDLMKRTARPEISISEFWK